MPIRPHLQHTCRSKPPRSGATAVAQIASANHPHTTPATPAPASDSVGQQDEISNTWHITAIRLIGQPATVIRLQVYPVGKVQLVVAPLNPCTSPKSFPPCTMPLMFNSRFPALLVTVSTKSATGKNANPPPHRQTPKKSCQRPSRMVEAAPGLPNDQTKKIALWLTPCSTTQNKRHNNRNDIENG